MTRRLPLWARSFSLLGRYRKHWTKCREGVPRSRKILGSWRSVFEFKLNSYTTKLMLLECSKVGFMYSELGIHHHSQFWGIFITPKRSPAPLSRHCPVPLSPQPAFCLQTGLFWTLRLNGILSYGAFYVWTIHIVVHIRTLFLFIAKGCSSVWIRHILFLGVISRWTFGLLPFSGC